MYFVGIACVRDMKRGKGNVRSVIVLLELTIIIDYIFPHEEKICKSGILFFRSVTYLYLQMHFLYFYLLSPMWHRGNANAYFPLHICIAMISYETVLHYLLVERDTKKVCIFFYQKQLSNHKTYLTYLLTKKEKQSFSSILISN